MKIQIPKFDEMISVEAVEEILFKLKACNRGATDFLVHADSCSIGGNVSPAMLMEAGLCHSRLRWMIGELAFEEWKHVIGLQALNNFLAEIGHPAVGREVADSELYSQISCEQFFESILTPQEDQKAAATLAYHFDYIVPSSPDVRVMRCAWNTALKAMQDNLNAIMGVGEDA